jgi:hypothetical protein
MSTAATSAKTTAAMMVSFLMESCALCQTPGKRQPNAR